MQEKYEIEQLHAYPPNQNPNKHINLSQDSSVDHSQVLDELMIQSPNPRLHQNRYGNIHVLYENQRFLITIGPDYICFCIAYIFFTIISFTIVFTAATQIQNTVLNVINIVYSIMQNLSYLMVALSNPGVETSDTLPTQQEETGQIKRFCKKCNLRMQKGTQHCRDCGVCIRNFDHHCPWTSKCIGEKNLSKFYVFVTLTFTYIIYCMIALLVCSAGNALELQQKLNTKTI